ncbi:MAG TPA: VCBS repeat-containing protein, partial [Oligoflexia bacterium]|nr:VCBS repeat-containing protein [Oligoflexia bacterium]
ANQLIFSTRDTIQVRGSAAGTDFDFYTISWCPYAGGECRTDGVMLENNGQTPLREAVLGQFNLSSTSNVLPGLYYISLITHRTNAQTEEARSLIYIDPLLKENSSQPFPLVCVSIGCYSLLQQPIAYDINHDGKAEIIFAYYDTIKITDERLNPLPGWPYILPQNGGLTQLPPSVGDIDNDGQEEIVVLAGAKLYAFEHDGSLMSGFPQDSFDYGSSGYVFTSPRVLVDLNGDGYKEILSANMRAVDALGRQPAGWNPVQPDAPANQSASWSYGPAAADIDLDGQSEVAAISLGGAQVTLRLFAANGALRWSRTVSGVYAGEPTLVDLDGDSRAEILFTASDANLIHVYAYKHDGTPANGFPRDLTGYATADSRPAPISAADFTLDGVPELVALGNNCIYILSAAGNLLRTICNSSSRAYYTAQIANLDADPEPEIITAIRGASGLSYGNNAIFGQFAY